MPTFKDIKTAFRTLSEENKEKLLHDVYRYSKEMKLFLEGLLLGHGDGEEFFREMEKETIGKVYRRGTPQTPNGKTVQSILTRAKKAHASIKTMLGLEKLAYRGFIEFLNEYGGGPDSFDSLAAKHFEAYLKLVQSEAGGERNGVFEETRKYLLTKNNMYRDDLDAIFEDVTGVRI